MTAEPITDLAGLTDRVVRLERQNRRLKVVTLGVALFAGTAVLMGSQDSDKDKKVSADRYELRDSKGKDRLRIGVGQDGPALTFLDDNGAEQATLGVNRRGVQIRYVDARGQLISGISLERSGIALVNIDDSGRLQSGPNALKPDAGLLGPGRRP